MKKLIISLLGAISFLTCNADKKEIVKYEFAYGDTIRTYSMYLPDTLRQNAPLVIYTHGYGSKTRVLSRRGTGLAWKRRMESRLSTSGFHEYR